MVGSILPGGQDMSWQKLNNNAPISKGKPKFMNLILVRMWNEIRQKKTIYEKYLPEGNHEARIDVSKNNSDKNDVRDKQANELTKDDKELEKILKIQIETMDQCFLLQLVPHERLPRVKLTKEIEGSSKHELNMNIIPGITDKVYAMEKAIAFKLGVKRPE